MNPRWLLGIMLCALFLLVAATALGRNDDQPAAKRDDENAPCVVAVDEDDDPGDTGPSASPSGSPSASPSADEDTVCPSPTPSPTPTASPTPTPSPTPSPTPRHVPDTNDSASGDSGSTG